MNNNIESKLEEIVSYIKGSHNYQKYLKLKNQMQGNQEITNLIEEIRLLQKDLVKGKIGNDKILQEKIDYLNDIPLYREYNNTLVEINNTLNIIENDLNNYFKDKFN